MQHLDLKKKTPDIYIDLILVLMSRGSQPVPQRYSITPQPFSLQSKDWSCCLIWIVRSHRDNPLSMNSCSFLCSSSVVGYAVLLLEHGVLCVLPMLGAALLCSDTGWGFWTGWATAVPPGQTTRKRGRAQGEEDWTKDRRENELNLVRGRNMTKWFCKNY